MTCLMDFFLAELSEGNDLRATDGGDCLVRYTVHAQLQKAPETLVLQSPRCKKLGTRLDALSEVYPTGITR